MNQDGTCEKCGHDEFHIGKEQEHPDEPPVAHAKCKKCGYENI